MSSVFLTNLDDFIAPSQACVVQTHQTAASSSSAPSVGGAKISLALEDEEVVKPSFGQGIIRSVASSSSSATKATVSLNDCLACSGCVTSAESVLIADQSIDKFKERLTLPGSTASAIPDEIVVVTLSPQTVASIAVKLSIDTMKTFNLLRLWLRTIGVTYICNAAAGADIALIKAREEFITRYQRSSSTEQKAPPPWIAPNVTTAHSTTRFSTPGVTEPQIYETSTAFSSSQLPVFTSSCPGWICYAEKTHPEVLSYVSATKSPQQILGAVLKGRLLRDRANRVFHVSVQPCFDKKLEASRRDFFHEDLGCKEVDLVLSTSELYDFLVEMALQSSDGISASVDYDYVDCVTRFLAGYYTRDNTRNISLDQASGESFDELVHSLLSSYSEDGFALCSAFEMNGGSGGYIEYIFRYAAERLFQIDLWGKELIYKEGRNPDTAEIELMVEGVSVLRFSKCYGFRNIQSVMSNMKRGKCNLHFVEIMACPGGCNGGGGQLKDAGKEAPTAIRARVGRVDASYHAQVVFRHPDESPLAKYLHSTSSSGDENEYLMFYTHYHNVPKLDIIAPLASKW
jgi:iron only hydrogenase large subunit-like protein